MRRFACVVLLAAVAGMDLRPVQAGGPVYAQARTQQSMVDMVAAYADWAAGRRPSADLDVADLDAARRELGRMDPGDIPVDPAWTPEQAREMRRRVMTTFAVELAALGARRHASAAAHLVEWACAYVRAHSPTNDFDRAWQLAALSVLEGGIDSRGLADHVAHMQTIFPTEPRLQLARGIAEEQFGAPSEALVRTESAAGLQRAREALARAEGESFRASERAVARFGEAAAASDAVAAEALLRAGHVQMRLSRFDAALASWQGLERRTQDPALLYLLHLFRGIAYEGRARVPEARASYKSALAISPGAHSATLRLAALAFRYGHSDEEAALADALMRDDDPRRDPWWSYYAADWRFWYPRIAAVRVYLKQP
jgi:tetratricopeptide (TPR) repeat protein